MSKDSGYLLGNVLAKGHSHSFFVACACAAGEVRSSAGCTTAGALCAERVESGGGLAGDGDGSWHLGWFRYADGVARGDAGGNCNQYMSELLLQCMRLEVDECALDQQVIWYEMGADRRIRMKGRDGVVCASTMAMLFVRGQGGRLADDDDDDVG